jgi:hypothetical protein
MKRGSESSKQGSPEKKQRLDPRVHIAPWELAPLLFVFSKLVLTLPGVRKGTRHARFTGWRRFVAREFYLRIQLHFQLTSTTTFQCNNLPIPQLEEVFKECNGEHGLPFLQISS